MHNHRHDLILKTEKEYFWIRSESVGQGSNEAYNGNDYKADEIHCDIPFEAFKIWAVFLKLKIMFYEGLMGFKLHQKLLFTAKSPSRRYKN